MSQDNYRVLVADDIFLLREVIGITAEVVGCSVDRAANEREVLSKLKNNRYDLY